MCSLVILTWSSDPEIRLVFLYEGAIHLGKKEKLHSKEKEKHYEHKHKVKCFKELVLTSSSKVFRYMAFPQSTMALSRLLKVIQTKMKTSCCEVSCLITNFQTIKSSASPWGLDAPPQSSSQLGLQTSAPCPALLSDPYLCHAARGEPGADTVASVWEERGSCVEREVWGLMVVVVVLEAGAVALQS